MNTNNLLSLLLCIGSGGNILGGTGIAEVTLSVDERLKQIQKQMRTSGNDDARKSHDIRYESLQLRANLPISFGKHTKKGGDNSDQCESMILLIPTEIGGQSNLLINSHQHAPYLLYYVLRSTVFQSLPPQLPYNSLPAEEDAPIHKMSTSITGSYSQNFSQHTRVWIANKQASEAKFTEEQKKDEDGQVLDSSGRIGFAAARGKLGHICLALDSKFFSSVSAVTIDVLLFIRNICYNAGKTAIGESTVNGDDNRNKSNKYRSKDDKVYRNFINRQRERGFR